MEKHSSALMTPADVDVIQPTIEAPEVVKDFFERTGAEPLAQLSLALVRELFPRLATIDLEVGQDFEEPVEWLEVRLTADAPAPALTMAYREYVARWVRETPADKRLLVRLSYARA